MTKIKQQLQGWRIRTEYILDNHELSRIVDTSDEWIMQRIGIRERRIMKEKARRPPIWVPRPLRNAEKNEYDPLDIQLLICAMVTADMHFPASGNLISDRVGLVNAFSLTFCSCSGLYLPLKPGGAILNPGLQKNNCCRNQ